VSSPPSLREVAGIIWAISPGKPSEMTGSSSRFRGLKVPWMDVSLTVRVARITITVLWILTAAFSIILLVSTLKIRVQAPSTAAWTFQNNSIVVSVPYEIDNGGLFALSPTQVHVEILPGNSLILLEEEFTLPGAPAGERVGGNVTLAWDLSTLLSKPEVENLLVSDTNLTLRLRATTVYAQVFRVELSSEKRVPWRAPIRDLTVEVARGEVEVRGSGDQLLIVFPIRFSHSGWVTARGVPLSYSLSAPWGEIAAGSLTIEELSSSGVVRVEIPLGREDAERLLLNETVLLAQVSLGPVSLSREIRWEPILSDLEVSEPVVTVYGPNAVDVTAHVSLHLNARLPSGLRVAAALVGGGGEVARVERTLEGSPGPVDIEFTFRAPLSRLREPLRVEVYLLSPAELELARLEVRAG